MAKPVAIALGLIVLLSLILVTPSVANPDEAKWSRVSLPSIDTEIRAIIDLAPSPSYSRDETLFMVTWGRGHSLWRSLNGGRNWEQVYAANPADAEQIDRVELPPNYGKGNQIIYLAGSNNSGPAIWKSEDNGQRFSLRSTPIAIDTWVVANETTLFIGGYDGSNGLVYSTTNSGLSFSTRAIAGSQPLNSITLSPDYNKDKTILLGNTNGWVYWSNDNGNSFKPLPANATSPPLSGSITVAFDPRFSSNRTIYAASDTVDKGIYRFTIGSSSGWEKIDSTLPKDGMIGQVKVAADGTLYATNFKTNGGLERSLNPAYSLGPTFETVTDGLDEGATLIGLWLCGNQLWSIDTTNTRLVTYVDTLAAPVTLTSPPNKASGIGTIISDTIRNASLDWELLESATSYKWQLDDDTDFASIPSGFEGDTKATSARLPPLRPATRYYWRVRATEPVLSPWSARWSFTTASPVTEAETAAPRLYAPEQDATGVPISPVFRWSAVAGAKRYELVVAADASFASPIIAKVGSYALSTTTWECDIALSYDTTYYWKVRAISSESHSDWSTTYTFTTESLPTEEPPLSPSLPQPPPPPPPPARQTTPDWATYTIVLMGGIIILLMIAILMLVTRRP